MSKKVLSTTLALSMLMMAGCSTETVANGKTGTYYGEAEGFGGTVSAYVTLDNGTITDVKLEGLKETVGKGSVVIEQYPAQIVEKNSTEIDEVSGATITSNAVKEAVTAALNSDEIVEYVENETEISFKAGTYTASSFGHNDPTTVEVTFSDTEITSVVVTEDKSTKAMSDATIETIPQRIVEQQSLNIDTVTGATESSSAIINAVADCVTQAANEDVANALFTKASVLKEVQDEEYTADVVVVGGGGSGLTTAMSLAQQGYQVVVLEAADILGGMTNVCGGGSLSIGSDLQKNDENIDYGSDEAIQEMLAEEYEIQLAASGLEEDPGIIQAYVDSLDEFVDWAVEAGIGYVPQKTNAVRLDNRGFRFYEIVEKMSNDYDTTILTGTRGTDLIVEDGNIAGVIGTNRTGGKTTVHAKAVVLATGGFLSNEEMVKQYIPSYTEYFENWSGSSRYQGDGVQMAWSVGAAVGQTGVQPHDSKIPQVIHNIDIATHAPTSYSNAAYYPSLWIDENGVRITNEDVGNISAELHGAETMKVGHYYTIVDQTIIDKLENGESEIGGWMFKKDPSVGLTEQIDQVVALGHAYKAETIEELAEQMNIDLETLTATINEYNDLVAQGEDTQYGKDAKYLIDTLQTGPYYALENTSRILATYGGLVIDENMNVVDTDGNAIAGLYAVGLDAGSFMGEVYSVTTTTASFAISSGYIAGNSIGEYLSE